MFEEGISFAEHWKLVAETSEFHLTLKRAHRMHFFQLEIRQKKAGHFKSKAGKRDGDKKSVSLRPKAVLLTPMVLASWVYILIITVDVYFYRMYFKRL